MSESIYFLYYIYQVLDTFILIYVEAIYLRTFTVVRKQILMNLWELISDILFNTSAMYSMFDMRYT